MSRVKELREYIYREVLHEYHVMDAIMHVALYLENNEDVDPLVKKMDFDFDYLAEMFEENHDCNIADNDQWQNIIEEYIRANQEEMTE